MENLPEHAEMKVVVGIPTPMRLIGRDEADEWSVTLDDVNKSTFNWVKLNRISGGFDGNIAPFAMLVGFDGSLVIPELPEFAGTQRAVEVFNRVLAELLLGGQYTEAIMPNDVCHGVILQTGYVRISAPEGGGGASRMHASLRSGEANNIESIVLLNSRPMPVNEFESAVLRGRAILSAVPNLSPELFLAGITHFVRQQWSEAMVIAWTSAEQIISHLWEIAVIAETATSTISGRKAFLSDYRTWPVSTRIEVLFQKGVIDDSLYGELDLARKARNAFIHNGRAPTVDAVRAAIGGMFELLIRSVQNEDSDEHVNRAKTMVLDRIRVEKKTAQKFDASQFVAWRHIKHLPGEKGWTGDFEPFDLGFKPIEELRENRPPRESKGKR